MERVIRVICVLCLGALTAHAIEQPNIVFLLADDMSRDTWGAYGGLDCKTPNIDTLAAEGVKFDRSYCSVAMCAPFRQELYSGRTPWRTGTLANHSKSKAGTKSLPHYLKALGYRVALLGKSHIGPQECYPFEYIKGGNKREDQNDVYLAKSREFMDSCAEEEKPFCLFIASNDSHAPFTTGDRSVYDAAELTVPPYWVDTEELRNTLVAYYAEISNFDSLVGRVRAELEARGLWENTLFIVCSEQGTQLPFAKWTCYDQGLGSGLVAHWMGVIEPGSVVDELVSIQDITPTLVDAAGGSLGAGDCDGKSLLGLLKGQGEVIHDYLYGAFTNCNISDNRDRIYPIRVIRNKEFSLIYNPNHSSMTSNVTLTNAMRMLDGQSPEEIDIAASWVALVDKTDAEEQLIEKLHQRPEYELYDLTRDPYELHNEIDNPEYQATAEALKQQLKHRLAELNDSNPIATEESLFDAEKAAKSKKKKTKKKG